MPIYVDDLHAYASATKLFHHCFDHNETIFQFSNVLLKLAQGTYGQAEATQMRDTVLKDFLAWFACTYFESFVHRVSENLE